VPAVCQALHASFFRTADEGNSVLNTLELQQIPGLNNVQFTYNDSTNALISYRLTDNVQWIGRYLESFRDPRNGTNAATLTNIYSNDVSGLGLDFGGPIDLSSNKLSIQIDSGIAESYTCYMYFSSFFIM